MDSATLMQRFSFVSSDNNARLAILAADGATDSELVTLTSQWASQEINVDAIRRAKANESRASARAYYQLIDPNNEADTLTLLLTEENSSYSIDLTIFENDHSTNRMIGQQYIPGLRAVFLL